MASTEAAGSRWVFPRGILAVCAFEMARSLSLQRILLAIVLAGFPAAMLFLILVIPQWAGAEVTVVIPEFLLLVLVSLVCFLSLLLWSSSVVDADLEGKTWSYLASRPRGRISSLLGKWLASVLQSFAVTAVALAAGVAVARSAGAIYDGVRLLGSYLAVFAVGTAVYAAVMSFLGTLFFRRAMVACVAWAMVSELFLANIPAVVRFATIRYHLQELVFVWYRWLFPVDISNYRSVFGNYGIWFHLLSLGGIGLLALAAAAWRITHHEYLSAEDA